MSNQRHSINNSGIAVLHAHFEGVIATTAANAYWKDTSGKYLGGNHLQVIRSGLKSQADLINATDYDLSWKTAAPILTQNDQSVIVNKQTSIFTEKVDETSHYLSYKSPLLNRKGRVVGVFGLSYLISKRPNNDTILHEIALLGGYHAANIVNGMLYQYQQSEMKLTARQIDCLRLLAKGMTMKHIALVLSLSPRTVEHYIDAIKCKLHCSTRVELVQMAHELGLVSC